MSRETVTLNLRVNMKELRVGVLTEQFKQLTEQEVELTLALERTREALTEIGHQLRLLELDEVEYPA